MIATGKMRC